jgi:hypothetical protein
MLPPLVHSRYALQCAIHFGAYFVLCQLVHAQRLVVKIRAWTTATEGAGKPEC